VDGRKSVGLLYLYTTNVILKRNYRPYFCSLYRYIKQAYVAIVLHITFYNQTITFKKSAMHLGQNDIAIGRKVYLPTKADC